MKNKLILILSALLFNFTLSTYAQYLHAEGREIHDGDGNNFIIRSMGLGGWMLQEGYLMKSDGAYGTQWAFKQKLAETIGEARTEEFYDAWLANHCTKADIDSLKAWGFNTVRVPLHYNLFTLPIEDEPIITENTWLTKGFDMMDELLSWCEANEMYVILDLHAAPGGQGANADICDYDPSKPSLWESEHNRNKMVALWGKLAERYANEKWVGGYDLLNETNWTLPNENALMLELYLNVTEAIRAVDQNHILFIEGNSWANDYTGLTPPWDNNMAYSFHKYWSYNRANDLDWVITLGEEYNVPLWLGETGENSNTWYTDLIALCEANNVGWSWWPLKKAGINNPMEVPMNEDYEYLMRYWKGEETVALTEDEAYNAVMTYARNYNIANVKIKYDVVDAMMRQPYTTETIPFKNHLLGENIYLSDYDLGRNGSAYSDNTVANYSMNTNEFVAWNTGWSYRNDGVDMQKCTDTETNGYNLGWVETNEWLQYTINVPTSKVYDLLIRNASATDDAAIIQLLIDDVAVGATMHLDNTGGWDLWEDKVFSDIVLSEGTHKIKLLLARGGSNLNYMRFTNARPLSSIETTIEKAYTNQQGTQIQLVLNKEWDQNQALSLEDVAIKVNNESSTITSIGYNATNKRLIDITIDREILFKDNIALTVNSTHLIAEDGSNVGTVANLNVENTTYLIHQLPGNIKAENYFVNSGFELEECLDTDGGNNLSFADRDDYVDYKVQVAEEGFYELTYRIATAYMNAKVEVIILGDDGIPIGIQTSTFVSTDGWQQWDDFVTSAHLKQGEYILRFKVKEGSVNINRMSFTNKVNSLSIPGKIQTEFYTVNQGLNFEHCADAFGGYNTSYADPGDYLDFNVEIQEATVYNINYRVAAAYENAGSASLSLISSTDTTLLTTTAFEKTGGWQDWNTFSSEVVLPEGNFTLRLTIESKEFNLNWVDFTPKNYVIHTLPANINVGEHYFNHMVTFDSTLSSNGTPAIVQPQIGSYLEFMVNVPTSGLYDVTYNAATPLDNTGKTSLYQVINNEETLLSEYTFTNTGGYSEWENQESTLQLTEGEYLLKIQVDNSSFNLKSIDFKLHVEDDIISSFVAQELSKIKVYPNPTNQNIKIDLHQKDSLKSIELYTIRGQKLREIQVDNQRFYTIDLSTLQKGIYILKLNDNDSTTVTRVVKN
ncbi:carbohydrate-binding protein [Flammeovirga kamogawensis]|uniref:Carbohydrate-binding protein n=1 Tax=Flammeovirga kamogawensis TaxID=373891 RepID=A0ABX8H2F0_9BACT|nr:carbohydrate-binding protein [Flammeovirga kamogawensis]MBB6463577.1 hypothetical protein [Flammeovirga kamogawensis]QWG09803.1 carbohydrate-binding protein [Flammeovirga kamogawensis]TRX65311.1 carbohydrate-binding protein [Flammeovirga kamogawensis]